MKPPFSWKREPFVHFLLLAGFLWVAHAMYQKWARPKVVITADWAEVMARDFETRAGRPASPEERDQLVAAYLQDEILYREALKSGKFDDPRIRHLLALTTREKLEPVVADPSDAELREYQKQHPEGWSAPASVSFEHASFGHREDVPEGLLERLKAGEPAHFSAKVGLPNPLPVTWLPQIRKMLGEDFAAAVLKAEENEWTGPIRSERGVHFVKVVKRTESQELPFEEVKPALASKWLEDRKNAAVAAKVEELKKNYRIELPVSKP